MNITYDEMVNRIDQAVRSETLKGCSYEEAVNAVLEHIRFELLLKNVKFE